MSGEKRPTTYPPVSVIIPTLNREKYIRQCIESVLSQDYLNLEVIVVDNGSTDNTEEILKSFGGRIKFLKEEKRGISAARNKGLRESQGEFIGLLDSDDFYLPGKISLSIKKLLENPYISLIYTDYIVVDSEGRRTEAVKKEQPPPEELTRNFLEGFGILPSTTFLRKACLKKSGYFDETMRYAEDTELWFRMLKAGCRFKHFPETLTAYRRHPENHSQTAHKSYLDRMYSSAIGYFTIREIFGKTADGKRLKRKAKNWYDGLTDIRYFDRLPLSARAASEKSLELGRPFFFSLFLTNTLQALPLIYSILETVAKISLPALSLKTTRPYAGGYRKKVKRLLFKLRYRLFRVFFYRYGLRFRDINPIS
ncbi:MAG: glycosyltransferase [Candidatus Omnitrophota bacterium]